MQASVVLITMEELGLVDGRGEVRIEMETVPLLPVTQTYLKLELGREPQYTSRCDNFVLSIFKAFSCSTGLWGHDAWNYIPRVVFSAICVYQLVYAWSFYTGVCPDFECHSNNISAVSVRYDGNLRTEEICSALFTFAAFLSYHVFVGSLILAKRKDSALVTPSQSMMHHAKRMDVLLLLMAFVVIYMMSCSVAWHYRAQQLKSRIISEAGFVMLLLAHWVSAVTCNVFALSTFALGTLVEDSSRLIRDLQNGTLDDIIRIHEDLCTVVFNTVSAFSVWFVLHWFTYGATLLVFLVYISEEIFVNVPTLQLVYLGCILAATLYIFLLPCVCAARITSQCAGIYEEINSTTSADWNEGHPFRDRCNTALFISYAKERACGFKLGRIRFNSSLAWFSFFFGLLALLYHV